MRARPIFPLLLFCCFTLLLAAFLLAGLGGELPPAFAGDLIWNDLQGPAGGPAQGLTLNPAYPADPTVLAGGGRATFIDTKAGLGIFRSQDGGLTWADRGGRPDGALMDVAFSPDWPSDRFVLAGFWQGVWSTTDGGDNWQMLSEIPGPPSHIQAVAVAVPQPGKHTLLAGGPYGGVYRSADEGATWTYSGDPGGVYRLHFHPALPNVALAATNTGLWRSTDAGLQWTRVTTTTAEQDVAFAADGSAVAVFGGRAWRSDDDGATWQPLTGTPIERLFTLGLSADGSGLFAAADRQLYRYDQDVGEFVALAMEPAFSRILRIAPSPHFADDQTVLIGTHDSVWRSTDSGQTFVRSAGFADLDVFALAAAGNSLTGDLYAGTEYGLWRRSGSDWTPVNTGAELDTAARVYSVALSPDYAQDQTLFATTTANFNLGASLHRSMDGGVSWQRVVTGTEYINQVVVSPAFAQDRRLYLVHVQAISYSSDGGATWTKPHWDSAYGVNALAISPDFAQDQTLVATGNGVIRSSDGGATWSPAANPPPVSSDSGIGWSAGRLHWGQDGKLYLSIYSFETVAPYTRHDQLWASSDKGETWSRIEAAPDQPVMDLATGPTVLGSGAAIYVSTFDDNESDARDLAPSLLVSRDGGATWLNLGAVPGGAARLLSPADAPDRVWAGSRGVWLFEAAPEPPVTPVPGNELLRNRSFEDQDVWRIPNTAWPAGYSQEQHFEGDWSMRTGIVDPGDDIYSFSDFSQDVSLPISHTITLRLHRWPSSGAGLQTAAGPVVLPAAANLEEFQQLVEAAGADLQYVLLIQHPGQPDSKINYLYTGLDNQQAWTEQSIDLSAYAGQSVRLQFGTFNNGVGPLAIQYFDVLSVQAVAPDNYRAWLPVVRKDVKATVSPAQ